MLNLIHAAVRVFLDVLAVAFVLEHTRELHEKHREINDAPKQVAGVVDEICLLSTNHGPKPNACVTR